MKRKFPAVARWLRCSLLLFSMLALPGRAEQYCESVPVGVYRFVGCNLSIPSISFPGNWFDNWAGGFFDYYFDPDDLVWTPQTPLPIPRGAGNFIRLASTNQVCFNEPTNAPVLPLNLASESLTRASCQSNVVATFEDIVGRAPVSGTALYRFMGGDPYRPDAPWWNSATLYVSTPEWSTYAYTNGVWSPTAPVVDIAEGVFIYQPTAFVYQPKILNPRLTSSNFAFELETAYGKAVTIEYSETLPATSWQELTSFTGTGHRRTVIDDSGVTGNTPRFYRIRTTQ